MGPKVPLHTSGRSIKPGAAALSPQPPGSPTAMASPPAQLRAHHVPLLPGQALLQEWGGALLQEWGGPQPSTEGYSSCSPTPSTDSCGLSPLHPLCPAPPEPCSSCPAPPRCRAGAYPAHGGRKGSRGQAGSGRRAAGSGQRQSASEREKLRMRNLAKALHTLRCYLPPSVAPAGQSLTKIETLRLAIRYIAHLSERLGLSEQALAQRREPPRRCQLCPEGLGCCQARTPGRRATEPWVSPSYCPAAGTPLWPHGAPGTDTAAWLSAPPCPDAATPTEPRAAPILAAGPMLLPAEFAAVSPNSQDLSGELLSLLEALLPQA